MFFHCPVMPLDFSGQNLQGRSFKGQNFEGANFSNADIRGANFTDANLRGTDFSYAKAGLRLGGLIALLMFSLLISVLSGLFLPYFPINTISLLTTNKDPAGVLTLLALGWFFAYFFIRQGLFIALVVVVVSATFSGMKALATSITSVLILTLAITIAAAVGRKAVNITLASSVIAALFMTIISGKTQPEVLVMVVIVTIATVTLSLYMSRKALAGDKKYAIIRAFAILFGISDGTCFQRSDLTNANFTGATLNNTNLLGANITRTCWLNVKKFHLARFDNTYLEQPQVRQLVVTGQGQDLNFDHLNLNGINLKGANLQDTSFIGAELNNANLQDTNLSRAKLKQTQLDGTDFTGANLTGAYIEDWSITSDTKFNGVRCEYVYMRLPTKENSDPLRKPDNRQEVFADGDFGDFIQPIFDTLDLYHNQGVDPRAIAIAFKQLAENNSDAELEIVAMEKRGEDKFLLRTKTAATASKSELSSQYFTTYNQLKALPEREIRLILAEKDNRIHCLENMVVTALSRPSFYSNVEKVGIMTNNPGGISQNMSGGHMDGGMQAIQGDNNQQNMNKKVSNFDFKGAQLAGGVVNAETVTANQIGGNITNYVPLQRQNLVEIAKEVQEVLQQMEQNYPTITSADKAIVVAKAIDEIEKNPNLKLRVIEALKAGDVKTFKNLIDHSLANKLIVSIEDWI